MGIIIILPIKTKKTTLLENLTISNFSIFGLLFIRTLKIRLYKRSSFHPLSLFFLNPFPLRRVFWVKKDLATNGKNHILEFK